MLEEFDNASKAKNPKTFNLKRGRTKITSFDRAYLAEGRKIPKIREIFQN